MARPELKQILLIDDDLSIRFVIKKLISKVFDDVQIFTTSDTAQGLGYAFLLEAEVIIVDTTLPKYGGLEVLDYIKSNNRLSRLKPRVIVLYRDPKYIDTSCDYVFIDKDDPYLLVKLLDEVRQRLQAHTVANYPLLNLLKHLGRVVIKFADRSDVAYLNIGASKQLFLKLTNAIRWFAYQFLTTVSLATFYILGGRHITELNPTQYVKDNQLFKFRYYPTVATFFAALLFLCFQGGVFLTSFVTFFQSQVRPVVAASYTWDGGGTDGTCGGNAGDGNKWSCAANWSTDIAPVAGDTVTFNATSTKDSTVDAGFGGDITIVNINSGYTGTITLARSLTVSSTFTQAAGNFTASNQAMIVSSTFTLNAGVFTASSGVSTFTSTFSINGGTFNHNSGTINFNGSGLISCNSTTFNLITFNNTGGVTLNSSCTLPVGASPTFNGLGGITLNSGNSITGTGTLTKGSATLTLNAGSSLSGFSGLSVSALTIAGATADYSAYSTFVASGTVTLSSGSLSLPSGADLNGALTISGGTFNAPSGVMTLAGSLTISGSPTFNANGGTITFDGAGGTLSCNNVTFNLVSFTGQTGLKTVNSNCNLPIGNNPIVPHNLALSGTLTGTGTLTATVAVSSTLTLNAGATLSGFSGLITQGITVAGATANFGSYSTFVTSGVTLLSSGTLTLPNGADLNNPLTISGGTFNAPSGVMTVAGSLTISGSPTFNHNNGTITFDSTTSATLSCNNVVFNLVTFAHTSGTKTVNSNCSLPMGTNPTTSTGPIVLNGTLSGSGTFTNGGGLTLNTGAVFSGFNALITTSVNGFTVAGATADLSAYTSFVTSGGVILSSGSLSLPSGSDLNGSLVISGGTFNAPNGTMTLAQALTISGSPTFNHNNGTVTFDGSSGVVLSCNNVTFNLVTFAHTANTKTVNSNCTLPLGNNPMTGSGTGGAISLSGTLTGSGTMSHGTGATLTLNSGASLSGFSGLAMTFFTVAGATANLSSYTTFTAAATVTVSSGSLSLPNGSDLNSNLTISGGTFTAPSGSMTVAANLTISGSPIFNANSGTITFDGAGATLSCNNVTFNLVTFNNTSTKTINSNCNIPLGANPSLLGAGGITLNGTLTGTGTLTKAAGPMTLNTGSALSGFGGIVEGATLTVAGAIVNFGNYNPVTLNVLTFSSGTFTAPSGTMTLSGNLTISGSSVFNHNNGTLILNGVGATLSCNNVTFNRVEISLQVAGNPIETVNSNCNLPLGANPTITGGVSLSGTLTGSGTINKSTDYGSFSFNTGAVLSGFTGIVTNASLSVNGATLDLSNYTTLDINDDLRLLAGSFTAPTGTMSILADITQTSGTFNHNNGTVILDGGAQTINGSQTFNNLKKEVISASTLTFASGTTQTILGGLTLKGADGNLLTLASSIPGTQWNINPQGTRDIQYLSVSDSNNVNANAMQTLGLSISNGGNNTNWNFNYPTVTFQNYSSGEHTNDKSPDFVFTVTDPDAADTIKYQIQIDNNADFSSPEVDFTSEFRAQGTQYFTPLDMNDGSYYLRIKGVDSTNGDGGFITANNGNVAFTIDTLAPTGTVHVSFDTNTGDDHDIFLVFSTSDNTVVTQVIYSESPDFTGASYIPYDTLALYHLSDGGGTKTVYVKFKDAAGNESQVYSVTVNLDTDVVTGTTGEGNSLALLILNSQKQPLSNVKIVINGMEAFTDENGVVVFENLEGTELEILGVYDNKEFRQTVTLENSSEVITIVLDQSPQIPILFWLCAIGIAIVVSILFTIILLERRKRDLPKHER